MRVLSLSLLLVAAACTPDGGEAETCGEELLTTSVSIEHIGEAYRFADAGHFDTDGDGQTGPIGPGARYTFQFRASPGSHLQLATMYVQSNDWMVGGPASGLALWDSEGVPLVGERADELVLWDAGTEVDQPVGEGPDQAPRQLTTDTGEVDPTPGLRETSTGFDEVDDYVSLVLSLDGDEWTAVLTNVAPEDHISTSGDSVDVLLSPGAFAVHAPNDPLFAAGDEVGASWEALAEDGDPTTLAAELVDAVGVVVPLASPFYALSTTPYELYQAGEPASEGLEALAEDGNAGELALAYEDLGDKPDVIDAGRLQQPDQQDGYEPRPAFPGETYVIDLDFVPRPNTLLHAAWMYAQSNDVFFGLADAGVELVDADCNLVTGDVTPMLWDAGTEVNQEPGFGADQAPRQSGPDTGADEGGVVHEVDDGFEYGDPTEIVRITVQ